MELPDFTNLAWFLTLTTAIFAVVIGRYLLIAGLFYTIFYLWFPNYWKNKKINERQYKSGQFRKEVGWSTITALIFALSGAITVLLWQRGYIKVYNETTAYPLWWLPVSLVLALVLHETYYYWLHRWMHHPKNFHKHFLGRWLIGATHHSLHHKQFRYNYGLYFTFWDKWKHTESPLYERLFEEKTSLVKAQKLDAVQVSDTRNAS